MVANIKSTKKFKAWEAVLELEEDWMLLKTDARRFKSLLDILLPAKDTQNNVEIDVNLLSTICSDLHFYEYLMQHYSIQQLAELGASKCEALARRPNLIGALSFEELKLLPGHALYLCDVDSKYSFGIGQLKDIASKYQQLESKINQYELRQYFPNTKLPEWANIRENKNLNDAQKEFIHQYIALRDQYAGVYLLSRVSLNEVLKLSATSIWNLYTFEHEPCRAQAMFTVLDQYKFNFSNIDQHNLCNEVLKAYSDLRRASDQPVMDKKHTIT